MTNKRSNKKMGRKKPEQIIAQSDDWRIFQGEIKRPRGHPGKVSSLFKFFGEKIPFEFLNDVKKIVGKGNRIYVAHDSMSYPRYIGRGDIFNRLADRKRKHKNELAYFSFYVVEERMYIRELETLLIHVTSTMLQFNERKKQVHLEPGSPNDFEVGTKYIIRKRCRQARKHR